MKIKMDVTGTMSYAIEPDDVAQAIEIKKMMGTQGWKILTEYWTVAREQLIEKGKEGIKYRAKKDLSPERWAVLAGFDQFLSVPFKITNMVDEYLKNEAQEEVKHED